MHQPLGSTHSDLVSRITSMFINPNHECMGHTVIIDIETDGLLRRLSTSYANRLRTCLDHGLGYFSVLRKLMRRRSGQKGRVLREPSSPARTVEFCLREPSSPARTVESCANRRVLREQSSPARTVETCANRRVLRERDTLREPSSPARTVETCANRRVLRELSSPARTRYSARTVESCANRRVLRERDTLVTTENSVAVVGCAVK